MTSCLPVGPSGGFQNVNGDRREGAAPLVQIRDRMLSREQSQEIEVGAQ
jgi:hypothetical protein